MNNSNYVTVVRLCDLGKTYAHVNKNCWHKTWKVRTLKTSSLVQLNLRVTDDAMMQRSHVYCKTPELRDNSDSVHQSWIVKRSVPLIYLRLIGMLLMTSTWGDQVKT